jgi:hypothetical protein
MSEIFRDRTEGALARRQDLLRKRRDEFVTMPHTIRRVIVSRAARTAASTAAIFCGLAMLSVALVPKLAQFVAGGLPGINPAVVSTGVAAAWVLGLIAFAISRGRAEHRFAVAMSTYVLPGDDLDHDIERLSHERPDRVAREMAHRLEVGSAALPVAAAAFVVPATLMYIAKAIAVKGWPSTAEYEQLLARSGTPLLYAALAGVIAAIVMTRSWARRDGVVPASIVAILTGSIAAVTLTQRELTLTWIFATASVLSASVAFVNARLSRERKALEIEDPAAGSEIFTLRGMWMSLRSAVGRARRYVTPRTVAALTAFGVLLVCAGGSMTLAPAKNAGAVKVDMMRQQVGDRTPVLVAPGKSSLVKWTATGDGRIRYDVRFVDNKPLKFTELYGMLRVPQGWKARIVVSTPDGLPGGLAVSPFPSLDTVVPLHLGNGATEHRFAAAACDGDVELGLDLVPDGTWPEGTVDVAILVEPQLELAPCPKIEIQ